MASAEVDIVELDGETYRQIRGAWYNARTFIKPPEIISRRLDERYGDATPPNKTRPQRPMTRGSRPKPGL
jgi:hypothetical protein